MVELSEIVGQESAVKRLGRALTGRRRPHAYIFVGPQGVGRRTTALAFARALLCAEPAAGDPIVAIGRYDRATYRAETDRCWVKIGECLAMDAGNCYRLDLRQGRLAAELTFWPTLPGWKAGTGHLLADPTNSRHFDWIVPLPRARVEGTLSVDGRPQQVTGEGYHDHNWGNVYLPSAFRGWTWGRIMADDWTLIFGDVVSRGSPPAHVTPFLLAHGEQIVVTTDRISVTGKDPLREPQTGRELFGKLHLSSSAGPSVRLELETRRKVEALDFAAPHACLARYPLMRKMGEYAFYLGQNFPFTRNLASWVLGRGSYVRWVADYHLELPDQDVVQAGQGLYEVMFL